MDINIFILLYVTESKSVPIRRKSLSTTANNHTYSEKLQLSRTTKIRKWSPYHDTAPKWSNWMEEPYLSALSVDPKITSWWNSIQQPEVEKGDEEEQYNLFDLQENSQQQNKHRYHMPIDLQESQYQFPSNRDYVNSDDEFVSLPDESGYCVTPAAAPVTTTTNKSVATTPTRFTFRSPLPPVNSTTKTTTTNNIIGSSFRFNNPSKNPFAHFGENYDSFTSPHGKRKSSGGNSTVTCPRNTIKSRLQAAKDACNLELRRIIDGLNEYVEKGLLYFETVDDMMNHEPLGEIADESCKQNLAILEEIAESSKAQQHHSTSMLLPIEQDDDLLKWDKLKSDANNASLKSTSPPPTEDIVTMISEDAYIPTPFILTLQDLICLAQSVLDTDLETFLDNPGACADTVSNIQAVGVQWDYHKEWPCREWYVRLLLGVAALNRVIEWWQAERSFWASSSSTIATPTPTTTSNSTTTNVTPLFKPLTVNNSFQSLTGQLHILPPPTHLGNDNHSNYMCENSSSPILFEDVRTTSTSRVPRTRENSVMSSFIQNDDEDVCQLQEDAEIGQSSTIVMELSLTSPTIQYLSPVWHDVIG